MKDSKRACPVERAGSLDNLFRKMIHNPKKIFKDRIKEGMTVLDLGCGPGFFSIALSDIVGSRGNVIATDIQEGMLDKLRSKIKDDPKRKNITIHRCESDKIGVSDKLDAALAFYVMHELPDDGKILKEIKAMLKKDAILMIIEPKFRVKKEEFDKAVEKALSIGFRKAEAPKVFASWAVVLKNG